MFHGHWVIADMDGTLTPTPTKAGGKYLSFTESIERLAPSAGTAVDATAKRYHSCLASLRFFIACGGSLCVVSTAGRRLWRQVYTDLAPALYGSLSDAIPSSSTHSSTSATHTVPGSLLLCGFTGAALFRSRDPQQVWEATRRLCSADLTVPPPSIGLEEWEAYRHTAGALTAGTASASTTLEANVCDTAVQEGRRAVVRFFEHASFTSHHNAEEAQAFFQQCLSTKYHATYTEMLRRCLAEIRTTRPGVLEAMESGEAPLVPLCFNALRVFDEDALTTHGFYLSETNDALVDAQTVSAEELDRPCDDPEARRAMPAAQVVVMGIPMRYCHLIFPDPSTPPATSSEAWRCCTACATHAQTARARLTELGLELKSQPNSVCLHRRGIDKETCVRWLLAHAAELGPTRTFSLDRALSFGDVPASVDRPLWQFPPMQFLSLSPKPHAGMDPVHDPLPSRGFYEVGGEEEGTACFLDALMAACESGSREPGQTWFTEARVRACANAARAQVMTWTTSGPA